MLTCSVGSDSLRPQGTIACQDPLSMELSRQEHWSGLPFPSPGDLLEPGIEPTVAVGCSGRCSGIFIIGATWLPYKDLGVFEKWSIPSLVALW